MKIINFSHCVCESTCYVNGLEDILAWKGADYMQNLLSVLGGMGEFAYLKFKIADPPQMVYWGANTKYLLKDLGEIIGFRISMIENRVFRSTFPKLKELIDSNNPVFAGALDMYYLHYYPDIYHKQHIPIHYVLVVGYSDEKKDVYVHDCSYPGVQSISYEDFEKSLDVNVPGMSKKNTIRTFILPENLPSELEIAEKGLKFMAEKMLKPPVKLFGIPAMRNLKKEIFGWDNKKSFEHLVMYATTPPHIPEKFDHSDGMRFRKAEVIRNLGEKYKIDSWVDASGMFENSGKLIIEICRAAMKQDKNEISKLISEVSDIEEEAYKLILKTS